MYDSPKEYNAPKIPERFEEELIHLNRLASRYYGGKWRLAPWIISHFPEHKNYVEPCGGVASVLIQKPRSELETYNDLDGYVVNYFRVLRDASDQLINKIRLTPWARDEYVSCFEHSDDPIESARRFWCITSMSINASAEAPGFRLVTRNPAKLPELNNRQNILDSLSAVAERFQGVQIENRDSLEIIKRFDNNDTLIYFDPPYVEETRAQSKRYRVEVNHDFHIQAALLLRSCKGCVVISGYQHPLYAEQYELFGWQRIDKQVATNSGGKRIESLWVSPNTVKALGEANKGLQMSLPAAFN